VDVAFTRIRSYARAHNNRLTDIARDIINGQLNATALAELSPRAH
jgi:hypothetical protein